MINHVENRINAMRDIGAERSRQIGIEGWTPEHDDEHRDGELADAAACYARGKQMASVWPWADEWWKPSRARRRNLVKAGALIVAEIERIDRLASADGSPKGGDRETGRHAEHDSAVASAQADDRRPTSIAIAQAGQGVK